jgi:hypothetical protein
MADELNSEAMEYFRKQGRRGGKLGAKARMEKLTAAERSDIARKAGKNRWKARNGAEPEPDPKPKRTKRP